MSLPARTALLLLGLHPLSQQLEDVLDGQRRMGRSASVVRRSQSTHIRQNPPVAMDQFQFPETRTGLTRKIKCGLDVYLTVNPMPDGQPGEIFLKLGKQGSTVSGLMQAWAVTVSAALQRGVSWQDLRDKYVDMRFPPTTHEYRSLIDAIARNIDGMIAELRQMREARIGQLELKLNEPSPESSSQPIDGRRD